MRKGSGQRLDIGAHQIKNIPVDVLEYGLAGLAIGLGALIAYILKQRGSKEASDSLAAENRLLKEEIQRAQQVENSCLLYTSPSPRDRTRSRMPSSA